MSTFLDKKINNNESSIFNLTNQQKLDLELDEFKAWLGERKKLIEKVTLFQSWWKWIYKNELQESINDCCVEIAEVNDLNSESIKKLTDNIVEQMSLHRSSAMRDLYKNCIKKLNNIQALLSDAREENISKKLESELSKKDRVVKERDRVVKEKDSFILVQSRTILELQKEHQDLKDCLDKTVSKQVKEEIQKFGKKHAYEMQELREENQELNGEKDRKIEELEAKNHASNSKIEKLEKENQASNSEIEKMKQENQERDKQVKTLMKLCNTLSLAQMVTQNVPNTEMSSVQLSQSLHSLEK